MTLRNAALAVALGSPLFALYMLGVLLFLDMDSWPGQYALVVPVALFLGAVPWGFLLHQVTSQSRPKADDSGVDPLSVCVAVLEAGKGALGVALGWVVIGTGEGVVMAGLAVLAGHTAASLLSREGRAGAVSVGALLAMTPVAGAVAVASVPVAILARRRGLPGGALVALAAFLATLVMAVTGWTDYLHLAFAGPAAALMLYQCLRNPQEAKLGC